MSVAKSQPSVPWPEWDLYKLWALITSLKWVKLHTLNLSNRLSVAVYLVCMWQTTTKWEWSRSNVPIVNFSSPVLSLKRNKAISTLDLMRLILASTVRPLSDNRECSLVELQCRQIRFIGLSVCVSWRYPIRPLYTYNMGSNRAWQAKQWHRIRIRKYTCIAH